MADDDKWQAVERWGAPSCPGHLARWAPIYGRASLRDRSCEDYPFRGKGVFWYCEYCRRQVMHESRYRTDIILKGDDLSCIPLTARSS